MMQRRAGWLWITGCVSIMAASGCDVKLDDPDLDLTPDRDAGFGDLDDLEDQAREQLRKLFPDLSASELDEIRGKLSASELLALRAELEKIRKEVAEFSGKLFQSAEERVAERKRELEPHHGGFPTGVDAVGKVCTYDSAAKRGEVRLSGVFDGRDAVALEAGQVQLRVDGTAVPFTLECLAGGPPVDIVFLIDITGSMSNVIDSVRDSVVSFVDLIESSGIRGTLSVVTFQDSVGVNRTFQQPAPPNGYERSPFFAPVSLDDASDVEALRSFVNRLEANRGADAPENLAAAVDFARNNVIGYTASGAANVIGDGREDPAGTAPFPKLPSDRQVFVAFTDITFHGDDRTASNSSLLAPFVPRNARDILASLHESGTTVHVSDPSWADTEPDPARESVDADYWAIHTGGVGEDVVLGYSLVDLELVVVAETSGLLDITLDRIVGSSCTIDFEVELRANASVELTLSVGAAPVSIALDVQRF